MQDIQNIEGQKEAAMDALMNHFTHGALTTEEFESKSSLISNANTQTDIDMAMQGLPPATTQFAARAPSYNASHPASDLVVSVFSGNDRKGVWEVARRTDAVAFFGGTNMDLRQAIIPEEGIVINCFAVFGGVDIIAPKDANIVVSGFGIFGGFDGPPLQPQKPGQPTIRIQGFACFGGVSVRIK